MVYQITRLRDCKKYIGQKKFVNQITRPPLKGKRNKRHSTIESNWRDYWGSNDELLEDIKREGQNGFVRDAVWFCKSKSQMNYLESKAIFSSDAIIRDDYYNSWVSVKVSRNQLKGVVEVPILLD